MPKEEVLYKRIIEGIQRMVPVGALFRIFVKSDSSKESNVNFQQWIEPFSKHSLASDNRTHAPVNSNQMNPAERAYYESNKYMAEEVSKIPFVGTPLVKLGEAVSCSAAVESLSPFQNSSPACQGIRDGKPSR